MTQFTIRRHCRYLPLAVLIQLLVAASVSAQSFLVAEPLLGGLAVSPQAGSRPTHSTEPAAAKTRIVELDELESHEGIRRVKGDQQPFSGVARSYYPTGQKQLEISFDQGLRHGKELAWYQNGDLKHEVSYRRGEPQGLGSRWYPPPSAKAPKVAGQIVLCSQDPGISDVCAENVTTASSMELCSDNAGVAEVCGLPLEEESTFESCMGSNC